MENWTFTHFDKRLERLEHLLQNVLKEINTMANNQADLDAAIAAEGATVTQLATVVTKIAADVTALLAKIAAGSTPADLTNEVTAINAQAAVLSTAAQQLTDADTAANK